MESGFPAINKDLCGYPALPTPSPLKKFHLFILAVLGLHCCMGSSVVVVHRLFLAVTALAAECGLWGAWAQELGLPGPRCTGS